MAKISKLPIRQLTAEAYVEFAHKFSKLPIRQLTTLIMYSGHG